MLEVLAITPAELDEIQTFASREPLNERRADLRAAMLALITSRAAGNASVALDDFLLDYDAEPESDEDMSPREMDEAMQKIAATFRKE